MKLFVTGHQGFLGSSFMIKYGSEFEIVGYDLKDGEDILDYPKLKEKMKGCEQVVHLAAIPKPVPLNSFEDYFRTNVEGTFNVVKAAVENKVKRVIYASSTSVYGIERGIPFSFPIAEEQLFVPQYLKVSELRCREVDLCYSLSKVMAEQIMAQYGLSKIMQTTALRFGPIDKMFLGTSVSLTNALQAIKLAIQYKGELWYEPFSVVDDHLEHISCEKIKKILGYLPEPAVYEGAQLHSTFEDREKYFEKTTSSMRC